MPFTTLSRLSSNEEEEEGKGAAATNEQTGGRVDGGGRDDTYDHFEIELISPPPPLHSPPRN